MRPFVISLTEVPDICHIPAFGERNGRRRPMKKSFLIPAMLAAAGALTACDSGFKQSHSFDSSEVQEMYADLEQRNLQRLADTVTGNHYEKPCSVSFPQNDANRLLINCAFAKTATPAPTPAQMKELEDHIVGHFTAKGAGSKARVFDFCTTGQSDLSLSVSCMRYNY
jgi:hypothetical protein